MGLFDLFQGKYRLLEGRRNIVPEEIEKIVDEALIETKKENYPAAIKIYKGIIHDYPHIGLLRNNAGCCLAALEKFDEAETEFLEAIRLSNVKREKGTHVPRSCLRKPQRNLIRLYKKILSERKGIPHASRPRENLIPHPTMPLKREIQTIVGIIRRRGIIAALSRIPLYLSSKCNNAIRWYEKVHMLRAEEFDRSNNIDTAGIVYQADLRMDNKNQSYATYYQGSDYLFFNNAVSSLKINFDEYTFIDFGSGKGKALFLASAYSFKKIIGIEFSEVLDAIAQDNIRRFKKDNIEARRIDAVEYEIPKDSLVCYFYDPFDGYIMAKVIDNIRKAYNLYRRNMVIVYGNPRFHELFDAEEWLERINHIGLYMIWSSK